MTEKILNYLAGNGWLVLSGGNTNGSPIRAQVLTRAKSYGTTAYISSAEDSGDSLMDDMEDLGARTGYFIDLVYESAETLQKDLEGASLIVLEAGSGIDSLYRALKPEHIAGIREAYQRGAVILFEGLAVNLAGRWVLADSGELVDGLDWISQAFVEPDSGGIDDSRAVQIVLAEVAEAVAINIRAGSALALGPGGMIEVWGEAKDVTISLGRNFSPDAENPS